MFLRPIRLALCLVAMLGLLTGTATAGLLIALGFGLTSSSAFVVGTPPEDLPHAITVAFPSASGSMLHGWWVPPTRAGAGAVVLMHGLRSSRLAMLPRARRLAAEGFGVLLFDFQAHGESAGRRITGGKLEALDAAAAVQFVRARQPAERVGVIGVSLGAAATVLGRAPLPVDAAVLESLYSDIDLSFAGWLRTRMDPAAYSVASRVAADVFDGVLLPLLDLSPVDLRPIEHIGTMSAPLLLAAGTADDLVPLEATRQLFAAAPEPKRLLEISGADHGDLEAFASSLYWSAVLPFLAERLRG